MPAFLGDRPRLLDWYCCEGGASEGFRRAGFSVYGADLFEDYSRRRYPFPAYHGDAVRGMRILVGGLPLPFTHTDGRVEWLTVNDFAAWAGSPPCQRHTAGTRAAGDRSQYPDLIGLTREAFEASGLPYVIENVEGAPLHDPIMLCGRQFDLTAVDDDGTKLHLDRHRLFESNVHLTAPRSCLPHDRTLQVAGVYGGARRDKAEARNIRHGGYVPRSKAVAQALLGVDWMTWKGMHQALPPVYTEFIGRQLLAVCDNHSGG